MTKKNIQDTSITCHKQHEFIQVRGTVKKRDTLSEIQEKIITFAASQVQQDDTSATRYTLKITDFADLCNLADSSRNGDYYNYIFEEVYKLKSRVIAFVDDGDDVIESYLEGIRLNRKSGTISFTIPESILPYYKRFNQYAKIDLLEYMPLHGAYALRLYEILLSWLKRGEVTYTIEELRKNLGLSDDSYPRTVDFMRRTIKPAIEEINKKSKFKVSYTEKTGQRKKIEALNFKIKKSKDMEEIETKEPIVEKSTLLFQMADFLSEEEATTFLEKYGEEYCAANLKYAKKHAKQNLASYFRNALNKNWAGFSKTKANPNCEKCNGTGIVERFINDPNYEGERDLKYPCDCLK